jgi:hypothetical protein
MLKHPFLDAPYNPALKHFLGGFDIYDQESLGEELLGYDPDCAEDRVFLINKYVLRRFRRLSYRHKLVKVSVLIRALEDESYDFSDVFQHVPQSYSSLPPGWDEMREPRAFFEDIYKLTSAAWGEELYQASQEDASMW